MSPAVEDFLSPSSSSATQHPNFQNPNPSILKDPTDSGMCNNSFNLVNSSKLDFDCSNDAAAPVRSSKRKHVKVKKQSSYRDSVSTKPVNSTANTVGGFVFNATTSGAVLDSSLGQTESGRNGEQQSVSGFLDFNKLRFTIGATSNRKLAKNMGSVEVQNGGNEFPRAGNLNFVFGTDGKTGTRKVSETDANELGKLNGTDFVFGVNTSNGVTNLNSSNVGHENEPDGVALHVDESESGGTVGRSGIDGSMKVNNLTTEVDSHLVNSMSSLHLETRGPGEVGSLINDSPKAEENNSSDCRKFENLDFVFSANHRDIQMDSNLQKEELKEKVDKLVPNGRGKLKMDAKVVFGTSGDACIWGNGRNDFTLNFTLDRLSSNKNGEKADYLDPQHFKTTQSCGKFDDTGLVYGADSHAATATPTEDFGKKDFRMSSTDIKSGNSVSRNVDSGIMFRNSKSKVGGVFHIGNENEKRSSFKGSRKLDGQIDILKSEEAGDYLNKLENNIDYVLNGSHSFVFGSNLGNAFGNSPLSKVSDETKTSNVHDPTKVDATDKINDSDGDACSNFNNLFVFGSDKSNTSCGRSATTSLDQFKGVNIAGFCSGKAGQKTDEVNKVPAFEKKEKSGTATKVYSFSNTKTSAGSDGGVPNGELKSGIFRKENQTINQDEKSSDGGQHYLNQLSTEAELIKDTFQSSSSSTMGLGFVPKVHYSEAPPTKGAGMTNNSCFLSKVGGFGASFAGFNTSDINVASSFTSDMFPGLSKKLEFSASNSVGERKLKKAKAKLRQQARSCQQGGRTRLSQEVPKPIEESPGCCSPMDVSPYWSTDCAPTSTSPATSQVKDEDAVDTKEKLNAVNFSSSSATSLAHADAPVRQRPHQKKYKMKTSRDLEFTTPKSRVDVSCAHGPTILEHTKAADQETCDKWRKRGNQAYKNGDLSEAEVCYSKGISSIQHTETPGFYIEPLLLCYSNRAATRMALGRMREGLKDCRMAAALDPNFVKANLRSANCHLLLGEVQDAFYNYNKCLESGDNVCLDRRIAIEAADGLQKAQKLADYLKLSAELLQQRTYESATKALGIIADALSISCYSEKLLNMKGEALFVLGKHEEVVQLCEQTLGSAEKNFAIGGVVSHMNSLKLWRWNLISKSYFHLGRLEIALDLIEKYEQLRPTTDKSRTEGPEESLIPLAVTIRELLHCKNAGNEAFQCGRHTEAVEHYTAAISKSIESRPFAAVCFCNRAAAHQSLGEIIDAIGDCSIAIALDGSYPKALSRRATLQEMIRDYKHAANDLQRLISILEIQSRDNSQKSATPGRSNGGSVKDLRRARRHLSSIEEKVKKERSLDLYLILGLKASDAASEVKKAYRKAALRHHPDKAGQILARTEGGNDGQHWKMIAESIQTDADRLFKMIGEAYAVLLDSTKRSKYDLEEEMWDDMDINVGSSSRRASDFYSSPYETTNRGNSQESSKTYGNSHYYYWQDSRKTYGSSYPRW